MTIKKRSKIARRIGRILSQVRSVLLDGLKHPHGKEYNLEEDCREKGFSATKIVEAYNLYERYHLSRPRLMASIYFLARCVVSVDLNTESSDFHVFQEAGLRLETIEAIATIAYEARFLTKTGTSLEERIRARKIFVFFDRTFGVQIPFPQRGCSASICSNCSEPVAFCQIRCPNCELRFIGPFYGVSHLPSLKKWKKMTARAKDVLVREVYNSCDHGNLGGAS